MKKLLTLIAIVLLASLAAQAATNYGFEVAGTTVTSDNCNNIVNNYITSGTVSYTPSNNTLIMYNVTINVTGTNNRVINNLENSGLTVMFRGTCNLKAQDASVIRIRKSTTLWAPQASDVVNINGVNDVGIWMATSNDFDLTIQGPGKFNISSTNNTAIEDEDDGSGTQLDTWHEVYFDNVNAVLSSGGNSVAKRVLLRFKAGSSVRFKATNNSSYPVINYCGWQLYGNETLLEPYGAYHDGSYVVDSNGNRVYNQDVYVSDDYVAIINATNFPDANFRSYVLGLYPKGYITQTDVNNRTRINIAQKNISNLKGIGYFTNLTSLYCNDNNLTSLSQLSGLSKMDELLCSDNQLTSLDLSYFPVLRYLNCSNNKLTTLNASNKSTLTQLYCQNNTLLTMLNCYSDNLTSLNVTGCTALKELRCYYNANLATITGLGDCTAITYLDCEDCAITNLSAVNSMTNIEKLYARNNKLTSLYVGELSYLNTLRVSGNTLLTTLYCYSCELTNLYVTGCSSLTYLDCSFNQLTSLDVTGCSALNHLEIYNNRINGTGMTTLVNSLPTRSASNKGVMYAVVSNDNNSMTSTQITIARNKYWLPYRYNGSTWVEMTASTRGDVDGNGNVNISDVTALIDYLLSGNASGINVSAADCDQNGAINISDVTALIDYLLSGHW